MSVHIHILTNKTRMPLEVEAGKGAVAVAITDIRGAPTQENRVAGISNHSGAARHTSSRHPLMVGTKAMNDTGTNSIGHNSCLRHLLRRSESLLSRGSSRSLFLPHGSLLF